MCFRPFDLHFSEYFSVELSFYLAYLKDLELLSLVAQINFQYPTQKTFSEFHFKYLQLLLILHRLKLYQFLFFTKSL
jgi:hypothetical protein